MTDSKPYLIRAINEWIGDNSLTPYLYVEIKTQGLVIPKHLSENNPLVLNISPSACQQLHIGNDGITFQARFNGRIFDLYLPIDAIIAIIARENGQGMTFEVNVDSEQPTANQQEEKKQSHAPRKAGLKIIK